MLRVVVCVLLALATAAPARAAWSPPHVVRASTGAAQALAVNGRGDVALAWIDQRLPAGAGTSVHVWTRAGGRARIRTLWSDRRSRSSGLSVVVDRRGEATVAWAAGDRVLAAYGPAAGGRWSAARRIGRGLGPTSLAAAPDRRVLLTFVRTPAAHQHDAAYSKPYVAWRSAGHAFARPVLLRRPQLQLHVTSFSAPVAAFDAAGRAYVSAECDAAVARTRPGSRRFGTDVLDSAPVLGLRLSVAGAGRGIAAWTRGRCTSDVMVADTPGPVFAAALSSGGFGARQLVAATPASDTAVAARPDGSGAVSFYTGDVFTAPVAAGTVGPPQPVADRRVPYAATAGGDELVGWVFPVPGPIARADTVIRPAGGGADEPAPQNSSAFAVAHPTGRAAAAARSMAGGDTAVSVWMP